MEKKENSNEFDKVFAEIFGDADPTEELKETREGSRESIEYTKKARKFMTETSHQFEELKLLVLGVQLEENKKKVNEFTHTIHIINKQFFALMLFLIIFVYLDGINILFELDKISSNQFDGFQSLNFKFQYINLDLWSLMITTLIMIGGTYYYTGKGFSKQLKYERALRAIEQSKAEMGSVLNSRLYKLQEEFNEFEMQVNSLMNNRLYKESVALSKSNVGELDTVVVYRYKSEFNISEEPDLIVTISNILETDEINSTDSYNIAHSLIKSRKLMHGDQIMNFIECRPEKRVTILINNNYRRFLLDSIKKNINVSPEYFLEVKSALSDFETCIKYIPKRKKLSENDINRLYENISLFMEQIKKGEENIFDYGELEKISMHLESKSDIYLDVIDIFWNEDIVLYEFSVSMLQVIDENIETMGYKHKMEIRELMKKLYSVENNIQ